MVKAKDMSPRKNERTIHYILRVGGLLILSSSVISLSLAINNLFLSIRDRIIHSSNVILLDILYIIFLLSTIMLGLYLYSKYVSKISVEQLIG